MTTMKERISNVIAWVGFVGMLLVATTVAVGIWYESREKPELVLLEKCKTFDTAEYWNENALFAAVAKKYSSETQLERCKEKYNSIAMWYFKEDVVVLTGPRFDIDSLWYVAKKIDGFTYVSKSDLRQFFWFGLPLWLISAVLNYILFGSARLLPWKKAVISDQK